MINPILIKSFIGSTTLRKTKNDKKDATSIALFSLKSHQSLHLASPDTTKKYQTAYPQEKISPKILQD